MAKREKLLERFRQNPRNVRFEEVDHLLTNWGFAKRTRGSHTIYTYDDHRITIPFKKPFLLPVYVKQLIALLEALEVPNQDESHE